jgi:hypothetical protein
VYCREILLPYCTDNAILQDPWSVVESGRLVGGGGGNRGMGPHGIYLRFIRLIGCKHSTRSLAKKRARMAGPEGVRGDDPSGGFV